ncbi:peptide-N-glycosidase F-related protein [Flavobacterium pedocola]
MKKLYSLLLVLIGLSSVSVAQNTIPIYSNVLFYDGYAGIVSEPTPEGVFRLRNDLFTRKLTASELAQIGNTLSINISISAACDNYDRIGNVNLALVPKGATSYDLATTQRIELGRYITPFMNKNVAPNLVPYVFNVDNVVKILKDTSFNTLYDFWVEFELFGVPYAANTQIAGCSGRNDVFYGTVNFISDGPSETPNNTYLLPLNFKKNLNNYEAGASDAIGQTVRTINFNLPSAINNSKFHLITSNHGANSGGEEYNRRWHYIDLDQNMILSYKPGELTCEPYRVYNTQSNGIYGPVPRSNATWQSFSNWCPGAIIPIRTINVGNLTAGAHSFRISVPSAVFTGGQGYFPISVYLQGENTVLSTTDYYVVSYDIFPNPAKGIVTVNCSHTLKNLQLFDAQGRLVKEEMVNGLTSKIDVSAHSNGIYFLKIETENGVFSEKIIKE